MSATHAAEDVSFTLPSGQTIAGLKYGDDTPTAVRVLALHGWLDNCATWHLVAPVLAEAGCCVVAVDFAGHGRSAHRSSDASYMALHYVEDVAALLATLGWVPMGPPASAADDEDAEKAGKPRLPLLLGHSMGAGIAALLAGAFPGKFSGLAMVESVGLMSEAPEKLPGRMGRSIAALLAAQARSGRSGRSYPSLEAASAARHANARAIAGQRMSEEAAKALAERGVAPVDPTATSTTASASSSSAGGAVTFAHDRRAQVPSPLYLTEEQVTAFFASNTAPTLIVLGEDGLAFPEDKVASRLGASKAAVTRTTLPGHHHLHADPPTAPAVAEAIVSWVRDAVTK